MKRLFVTLMLSAVITSGFAQTQVRGHTRSNGTYVQPSTRTSPNTTNRDNWSTTGNRNPNTGTSGTRAADYTPPASNYGQGRQVQTGPRGGQYYQNSNGTKTYVPKR